MLERFNWVRTEPWIGANAINGPKVVLMAELIVSPYVGDVPNAPRTCVSMVRRPLCQIPIAAMPPDPRTTVGSANSYPCSTRIGASRVEPRRSNSTGSGWVMLARLSGAPLAAPSSTCASAAIGGSSSHHVRTGVATGILLLVAFSRNQCALLVADPEPSRRNDSPDPTQSVCDLPSQESCRWWRSPPSDTQSAGNQCRSLIAPDTITAAPRTMASA